MSSREIVARLHASGLRRRKVSRLARWSPDGKGLMDEED